MAPLLRGKGSAGEKFKGGGKIKWSGWSESL